jgi:hypothetical protein
MDEERFFKGLANGHPSVKRTVGILENHLHVAAFAPQILFGELPQILPSKEHPTSGWFKQAKG